MYVEIGVIVSFFRIVEKFNEFRDGGERYCLFIVVIDGDNGSEVGKVWIVF